jgi:UDP-3-O-[3-hydroxymyristoyl] glucosamine N-acyltransferase
MDSNESFVPVDGQVYLKCPNPKLALVKVIRIIAPRSHAPAIHPTAVISPEAVIHESVTVGPHAVLEACEVGEASTIASGVYVGHGTKIGRCVNIAPGVVIGADGFGYIDDLDGTRINTPHLGIVEIEDCVDIGANTCIDRGTLGSTIIKYGAKIDNLVHIAHNVEIGRHAMVIANTMIGGSTIIGDRAVVAPSATLRDAITVGAGAFVGIGALVVKSVPEGETWMGHPARFFRREQPSINSSPKVDR